MGIEQITLAGRLWMDAMRSRWSLRRASGDSRWRLVLHMASWARWFIRQTQWLRTLRASESLWCAAKADPRLYERWHRSYISRHFNVDARRRIVMTHYTFVIQRFPAWLSERILLGGGARLTTVQLDDTSRVHLHLRKPSRGDAGELNLLLFTDDKDVLASCTLTFDRHDSITIGALRGAGLHAPFEATRAFIRGSHGLYPKELLMSLVRELAALHGLKRLRAVSAAACVGHSLPAGGVDDGDAFWEEQGGVIVIADSGCHELPLVLAPMPCAEGPHSRSEKQQRREAFRTEACEAFAAAFHRASGPHPAGAEMPASLDNGVARPSRTRKARQHASMLAPGL
jgi:uncharacterized protein VirK/YbjX